MIRAPRRLGTVVVGALVAATALAAVVVPAAGAPIATGSWAAAVPPIRMVISAVQLTDGRVLAAEWGEGCVFHCFELYDPVLGLWTPTSPLKTETPVVLQMVALRDGRAFVGLQSQGQDKIEKYRYDPDTDKWFLLPSNAQDGYQRFSNYTAVLLDGTPQECGDHCGKVLIAGGTSHRSSDGPRMKWTAELYDPASHTLTPTGSINELDEARPGASSPAATRLADGRVLLTGDPYDTKKPHDPAAAHIYEPNPLSGEPHWSRAADMPHGQESGWAVTLHDGRVLVAGDRRFPPRSPMLFDPDGDDGVDGTVGSWQVVDHCEGEATGTIAPCGAPALLADGTVLEVGTFGSTVERRVASVFDPDTLEWTRIEDPPGPYYFATHLAGEAPRCGTDCGDVLVLGGTGLFLAPTVPAAALYEFLRVEGLSRVTGPACGGSDVTISGSGFKDATVVHFGAVPVAKRSDTNPDGFAVNPEGTEITVSTPRHAPGTVPVTVTTGKTSAPDPDVVFTYERVEPATVSAVDPSEGRADEETPGVKISGRFPPECVRRVAFGGVEDPTATVGEPPAGDEMSTAVTATAPAQPDKAGTAVPVEVAVDLGAPLPDDPDSWLRSVPTEPGADSFTYLALPVIEAITPAGVSALGGTSVAITGTGFEAGDGDTSPPEVSFDGRAATPATRISDTRLETQAPSLPAGGSPGIDVGRVSVTTAKRGASPPAPFAYHPGVRGVFPPSGLTTGGERRTITGKGLRAAEKVMIGGREAKIVERATDGESLVVRTPGRDEPESVRVEVVAAGLISLETIFFSYGDPPPSDGAPGDNEPGVPPRQGEGSVQPVPPGGSGSPAPSPSPTPSPSPSPTPSPSPSPSPSLSATPSASSAASSAPGGSGVTSGVASSAGSAAPGQAGSAAQAPAPGQAPAGSGAPGVAPGAAPGGAAGGAAAPAQAAPGPGQAGVGADDDPEVRHVPRHDMTAVSLALGFAGAGAAACFSGVALAHRRRVGAARPRPKGAY